MEMEGDEFESAALTEEDALDADLDDLFETDTNTDLDFDFDLDLDDDRESADILDEEGEMTDDDELDDWDTISFD